MSTAFMTRDALMERIDDIAMCRRNLDEVSQGNAVANILAGEPAYWSMVPGPRERAGTAPDIAYQANYRACLIHALEDRDEYFRPLHRSTVDNLLDQLIPLSPAAIAELGRIYRLRGMWRDPIELRNRERRAIMQPWWPRMPEGKLTRDLYELQYAKAQARFLAREKARKAVPAMAGAA